jgi:hypothetical protein
VVLLADGLEISTATTFSTPDAVAILNAPTTTYGTMTFQTIGTERMRIDYGGNTMIAVSAAGGTGGWTFYPTGSGSSPYLVVNKTNGLSTVAQSFQVSGVTAGTITYTSSATAYNTSSDYRLKEAWVPMTGASERVLALKPINFAWKVDGSRVDGFLAHEAQAVVPECVTGTKDAMMDEEYEVTPAVYEDIITPAIEAVAEVPAVYDVDGVLVSEMVPAVEAEAERTEQRLVTEAVMGTRSVPDYQGIDQSKLVPLLTAALQEALTAITDLKARVAALEATP